MMKFFKDENVIRKSTKYQIYNDLSDTTPTPEAFTIKNLEQTLCEEDQNLPFKDQNNPSTAKKVEEQN